MCVKCKPLTECPIGEKRRREFDFPKKPNIVDYYGRTLRIGPITMYVDKWPDGHTDCGIYQDCEDENNVQYGTGFDITHCPYCGEKLV